MNSDYMVHKDTSRPITNIAPRDAELDKLLHNPIHSLVTRELARRLRAVEAELAAARAEIAELKRQLMTSDVVEAEAVING